MERTGGFPRPTRGIVANHPTRLVLRREIHNEVIASSDKHEVHSGALQPGVSVTTCYTNFICTLYAART